MTDTDNLREAIAAIFAEDDPFVGIGKSSYDKADRVLALVAAPQPAPEQGMTRAEVGQMLDAKRHDREALVEAIREANDDWIASQSKPSSRPEFIADALLARGLRLPGEETMAWAVVGEDGEVIPGAIYPTRDEAERVCDYEGERVVPVVICRVVEGGDDAA